jgi:putative membrane protein insertion efficiency factor
MTSKRFFIAPINAYQYVSRMLPGSCRYYPTCSEYAKWQFQFNAPHRALSASTLRILSCNQLFPGGIDYPVVHWHPPRCPMPCTPQPLSMDHIVFWLIPKDAKRYIVVKMFENTV